VLRCGPIRPFRLVAVMIARCVPFSQPRGRSRATAAHARFCQVRARGVAL